MNPTTFELTIALAGVSLLTIVALIFVYWRPISRVGREAGRQLAQPDPELTPTKCLPASVIVSAGDNARALERLMTDLLGQSYPSPYEIIVVLDGRSDSSSTLVDRLRVEHPNVYLTFIPDEARNVSRKKLGIMLGIKAARYPIAVLTTADTVIPSPLWLAKMTEPFADGDTQIVLGHSLTHTEADRAFGHLARALAESADNVTWLTAAVGGHPYRGIENNIAYTREVFFDNRGFARSLNLVNGDDDIFISEIARADNTAVVLHPDANVTRETTDYRRTRRENRTRYAFTGRFIRRATRRRFALGTWLLWIQAISAMAAILLAIAQLPPFPTLAELPMAEQPLTLYGAILVPLLLWLTAIITTTTVWRRTILALGGRALRWSIYPLALGRPLSNMRINLVARRHTDSQRTWTK